ncbi:hypothetical protein PCL_03275 [Purpureocillium lilacinum]|uniref:Uncharacterized protein n=1 Tax=Purpureocillium lilacinum TaxID=33203 RepID=A0A2U3ENJ4_PURLI|nr:hypothetical protein PCL_03275 [Purpureocillium lilacinum]
MRGTSGTRYPHVVRAGWRPGGAIAGRYIRTPCRSTRPSKVGVEAFGLKVPCSAAPGLEGRRDCSGAWLGWLAGPSSHTQPRGRRPKAAALWQGRAGLDRTGYLAARTSPQPGSGWQLGSGECGESGQWWCVRWYPAGRPAPADTQAARKTGTRPAAVVTGAAPGGNPAPAGARAHTSQGANNLSRGAAQRRSGGAPEQRYLGRALAVVVCFAGIKASDEAPIMVPCEHHHIRMHQSHWPMWPRAGSLMVNDERGPAGAAATGRQGQGRGPEREVPPYHLTRGPWSEIGDDDADFRRTLLLLFAFLHLPLPRLVPAILPSCQPTRSSAFLPLGPGPSCAQAWDPIHGGTRSFNPNSTAPCCNHRDESLRANARLPPSSDRSAIPIDHPNTNRHLHLMNGKGMAARTSYFTSPVRPRGHWELNKGPPSPSIAPALLHASLNIARKLTCQASSVPFFEAGVRQPVPPSQPVLSRRPSATWITMNPMPWQVAPAAMREPLRGRGQTLQATMPIACATKEAIHSRTPIRASQDQPTHPTPPAHPCVLRIPRQEQAAFDLSASGALPHKHAPPKACLQSLVPPWLRVPVLGSFDVAPRDARRTGWLPAGCVPRDSWAPHLCGAGQNKLPSTKASQGGSAYDANPKSSASVAGLQQSPRRQASPWSPIGLTRRPLRNSRGKGFGWSRDQTKWSNERLGPRRMQSTTTPELGASNTKFVHECDIDRKWEELLKEKEARVVERTVAPSGRESRGSPGGPDQAGPSTHVFVRQPRLGLFSRIGLFWHAIVKPPQLRPVRRRARRTRLIYMEVDTSKPACPSD